LGSIFNAGNSISSFTRSPAPWPNSFHAQIDMTMSANAFAPLRVPLTTKLESKQILLRCYTLADSSVLARVLVDNADRLDDDFVARLQEAKSLAHVEDFIRRKVQQWEVGQEYRFAIWDKSTLQFAGEVVLKDILWTIPKADIGYFSVREFEGKGRVTEALQFITSFAFETLQMRKLQIRAPSNNIRSQRVAERCLFKREGLLRNDDVQSDGATLVDLVYYGMTSDDYEEVKRKPRANGGFH